MYNEHDIFTPSMKYYDDCFQQSQDAAVNRIREQDEDVASDEEAIDRNTKGNVLDLKKAINAFVKSK